MGNSLTNSGGATITKTEKNSSNGESSRVLFLLYLIHRTWNVVVDSVDTKGKRTRLSEAASEDSGAPPSCFDESLFDDDDNDLDDEDQSTLYGSEYSFCSCSYCYDSKQNAFYSSAGVRMSICESELSSYCIGYQMAPSICQNLTGPTDRTNLQISSHQQQQKNKMTPDTSWQPNFTPKQENQRPPVYNPEDYVLSLKKFGKKQIGNNNKSIYDTTDIDKSEETYKSATLPSKCSEYKSPIPSPPETDCEMSLRQFGSITDLLTKLRADLRASFPSFVQEFVASPLDGVSMLLEVLRAIQLSQTMNMNVNATTQSGTLTMPRNSQSYQRRALLDELACLQCLSICCCRSPDASARLGTTQVGLLPLAASATGQGIRARILALQLLTAACDKCTVGHGSSKSITAGHSAVSEALSTLRLRCGEPVRFRLLIGMLNSGGGSGEMQAFGVKFLNTFVESAENMQNRLYLQAELFQAGFDPNNMTKTISSTSPWLEKLRAEIRHFEEIRIDVDKLQMQARESERVRSQMVILERRVQILQEEKSVLTSMERRLQERCAELQRQVFRLQGVQNDSFKSIEKRPIALPRHVPPTSKQSSSEHEDEGISSSETGPSLSPVPILVLPQNQSQKFSIILSSSNDDHKFQPVKDDDANIDDVIEELNNIADDAAKDLSINCKSNSINHLINLQMLETKEKDIVPVNLLPQPPRKSRSLAHLVSHGGSDLDASEYGMLLIQNHQQQQQQQLQHPQQQQKQLQQKSTTNLQSNSRNSYFDEIDFDIDQHHSHHHHLSGHQSDDINENNFNSHLHHHHHLNVIHSSTNREILDVIMDARQTEDDPTMNALLRAQCNSIDKNNSTIILQQNQTQKLQQHYHAPPAPPVQSQQPAQQFNGVFFMTEMNRPQKYPKPDVTAALQARRVTKNIERIESNSLDSMIDVIITGQQQPAQIQMEKSTNHPQIYFGGNPSIKINTGGSNNLTSIATATSTTIFKDTTTTTRSKSHAGSKVTDIPSGLY